MQVFLVTGTAGFIGFHLARLLLARGNGVIGIDNLNDYYDVDLKRSRLGVLHRYNNFEFVEGDITDLEMLRFLFANKHFEVVCHFAAQAGVRYSIENPDVFLYSNIVGFINVLDCCIKFGRRKMIYASSSSVYGDSLVLPFSERQNCKPKNLYARTKLDNEYYAQLYSNRWGVDMIGLRMFSVYGSWGRPDMACAIFAKAISDGSPLVIFGDGTSKRAFTYVEDVVVAIEKLISLLVSNNIGSEVFNIGASESISVITLVEKLEHLFGKKANKFFKSENTEEIHIAEADCTKLLNTIGYKPSTPFDAGLDAFVDWYRLYYRV